MIDLDAGLSFADLPADLCTALADSAFALFSRRGQIPDATMLATDVDRVWGSGSSAIAGPVRAAAAWLTRSDSSGLTGDLPPWL